MREKRFFILYLFSLLFLISGAAGLIYEIVWERLLELYFGVTMLSVTLIVSAYMAGLGIGSLVGGRIARRLKNTLFLYGLLEIGIALFGVFSPRLIVGIGEATAGSPYVLVFLISFAILLLPTTLMGATLPLLIQSFVDRLEISGRTIGLFYGINTLGAALGAMLAGYVLIGSYGFDGTIYAAVLLNAVIGLCALALSPWQPSPAVKTEPRQTTGVGIIPWGYRTILLSSFLVGFLGLGFEMLWIRILLIVNKNTAYAFPSILFVFLLGLALGGYFWGHRADTSSNLIALFCRVELAGAAIAAFTFLIFRLSLQPNTPWIKNFFETQSPVLPFIKINHKFFFSKKILLANLWNYFLPIFILVLPASLFQGGGLPILDRLSINHPQLSGRRVGDIHLANILGSAIGSLAISFLLLPAIGSEWTLKLLVLSTFLFPVFYFFHRIDRAGTRFLERADYSLISIGLVALLGTLLLPPRGDFYRRLYSAGTHQEVAISESGDSVLALTYDAHRNGIFWIGGEVNSFFPPNGVYESRALVCAGASQPKHILIIGFGGGYSTLFYKSIPGVERIVVVELLGDIAPFLSRNIDSARMTLADPRLTYVVDDGRRYLNAFPGEKFDLISIDPLRSHTSGHNNLYSSDALELYRNHLTPGGVLCAWMDEFHIIPHTVAYAFPYADQYQNEFMVASNGPITYHTAYMDEVAGGYARLTADMYGADRTVYLETTSALKPFLRDQSQILKDEIHKQILRDLDPWLEYYLFAPPLKEEIHPDPDVSANFESRIR